MPQSYSVAGLWKGLGAQFLSALRHFATGKTGVPAPSPSAPRKSCIQVTHLPGAITRDPHQVKITLCLSSPCPVEVALKGESVSLCCLVYFLHSGVSHGHRKVGFSFISSFISRRKLRSQPGGQCFALGGQILMCHVQLVVSKFPGTADWRLGFSKCLRACPRPDN